MKKMGICKHKLPNCLGRNTMDNYSTSSDDDEDNLAKGFFDSNLNVESYDRNELKLSSDMVLSIEVVYKIERQLDIYDTISLIFLLYETHLALDVILTILSAGQYNFSRDSLSKWAHTNPPNWSMALIEGLYIIQNYKILNNLGFKKHDIVNHFIPRKICYINKIKRTLYLLCEFLTKDQAKELIEQIGHEVSFDNDITIKYDSAYLEFHLLFWTSRGFLNVDKNVSLTNLTKHLKRMNLLDKAEEIDDMVKAHNNERNKVSSDAHFDETDAYPIKNSENVGLCIIVNMAQFKNNIEKKKEFKHLLPPEPLEDREGSLMDVRKLKDTFTYLKFVVEEIHDVFHYHLEVKIQSIIRDKFDKSNHSILVLCVLSHGDKGVVYASNSIPVKIQNIQNIISGPTPIEDLLANIPKVVIIEACQGRNPLFVEIKSDEQKGNNNYHKSKELDLDGTQSCLDGSGLVFDGPQFSPKYADVLTCLAIIEGFVAVRSIKEGTKYIQEFCKCLREYYKKDHLLDIVTRVHSNLNSRTMHVAVTGRGQWNCGEHTECLCIYMTPEAKHTLRKKLYLTPLAFKATL